MFCNINLYINDINGDNIAKNLKVNYIPTTCFYCGNSESRFYHDCQPQKMNSGHSSGQ